MITTATAGMANAINPAIISNFDDLVKTTQNWQTYVASLRPGVDRLCLLTEEVLDCLFLPLKVCGYKTPAVWSAFSVGLRARHASDADQGTLTQLEGLRGELME